eukprot:971805-Pelagomonas_calceolata.AAC.2
MSNHYRSHLCTPMHQEKDFMVEGIHGSSEPTKQALPGPTVICVSPVSGSVSREYQPAGVTQAEMGILEPGHEELLSRPEIKDGILELSLGMHAMWKEACLDQSPHANAGRSVPGSSDPSLCFVG